MAVNVKMGVDIGGFTSGIKQGQQILKGLNAELKASESEFNATGNAEQKLAQQTKTLNSQITVQKAIAKNAEQALKRMREAGVDPADASYQKLYVQMLNAQSGANDAEVALRRLGEGAGNASSGADQLTQSLNNISKKMSLQQVSDGIGKITEGLEGAVSKAVELGKSLWDDVLGAASKADDMATEAEKYDIPLQRYLQMQAMYDAGMDTSVDAIIKSQKKLRTNIGKESAETMQVLEELGLAMRGGKDGDTLQLITTDQEELFWRAGKALMNMSDAYDKEAAAQAMFGRSWEDLVPLFDKYDSLEAYNEALENQNSLSEETVLNLADLNDKYSELMANWEILKTELLGALAPALTDLATSLNDVLGKVIEYIDSKDGQEMLASLRENIAGLFEDIKNIDAGSVVQAFADAMNGVVDAFKWLRNHKNTVVTAITAIGGSLGLLKVSNTVMSFVNTLSGLGGGGGGGGGGNSGLTGAAGAAGAGGVAKTGLFSSLGSVLIPVAGGVGMTALGIAAGMAMDAPFRIWDENLWRTEQQARLQAADEIEAAGGAKWMTDFLRDVAEEVGIKHDETGAEKKAFGIYAWTENTGKLDQLLHDVENWTDADKEMLHEAVTKYNPYTAGWDTWNLLEKYWSGDTENIDTYALNQALENVADSLIQFQQNDLGLKPPEEAATELGEEIGEVPVETKPELPPDVAQELTDFIGTLSIPVKLIPTGMDGEEDGSFANGTWSVPYDGFLARLHRGERVMPAREVTARNYSSNLYVESMYMSGGADADGLAAAMAAAQRRTMSGYGS